MSYITKIIHRGLSGLRSVVRRLQITKSPDDLDKNLLKTALARHVKEQPVSKNAFECFGDIWSTRFVSDQGENLTPSGFPGTQDGRLTWLSEKLNLDGLRVIELGPLEGAHTYMLEKAGANVLAIESNVAAFLRCLIVKNEYGLQSKFVLGDFSKFNFSSYKVDLVLACGILYHMVNPIDLLAKISAGTNKLFIWTHYFEEDLSKWHPNLKHDLESHKWEYKNPQIEKFDGLEIKVIKQKYREALGWSGFCGGTEHFSYWVEKKGLLLLLERLGYKNIEITLDHVAHPHGPAFCVLAQK